jgi:hypothetical protein
MAHHVCKINTLSKVLTCTTELIYSLKYITPQYTSQYLKSASFILEDYYKNNISDWTNYINTNNYNEYGYHKTRIYTNNLIENTNININCNIITWCPGAETNFHGHENMGCIMMPLRGYLKQDLVPSEVYDSLLLPKGNNDIYKTSLIYPGETSYIDDEIGYHKITNENDRVCASLHIYYDYDDIDE